MPISTSELELPFEIRRGRSENVSIVKHAPSTRDFEQWYLLRADAHHDNPKCNQKMELRHLEEAHDKNAGIIDLGDSMCLMQGKYDPRGDKKSVRPEHATDRYVDSVINDYADFLEPYAPRIICMAQGNHETSIIRRLETHPTKRLCETLRTRTGAPVLDSGYTGWVLFQFQIGTVRMSRRLWFTHGSGGGGPMTSDMSAAARRKMYISGADIMASGHTHDHWTKHDTGLVLSSSGEVVRQSIWTVKCGTYKDDYGVGTGGWAVEKGHPPKPLGQWWIRFHVVGGQVTFEVLPAL